MGHEAGVSIPNPASLPLTRFNRRPQTLLTFVLLALCTSIWFLWCWRSNFNFFQLSFQDPGSNLTLVELLRRGQKPGIDFGYAYGLLSLAFSQAWFGLFGLTPGALVASAYVISLAMCYWFARLLSAIGGGWWHVLLSILLWPIALPPLISQTHLIEPLLILTALVLHAEGKLSWALTSCAVCVFVKPSLGYVYGLLLVITILLKSRPLQPGRFGRLAREFAPAAAVCIILGAALGTLYGWHLLLNTLSASTGRRIYSVDHFGIFGLGRSFFWYPGVTWKYYLGQRAGFWIFSMLALLVSLTVILTRRVRTGQPLDSTSKLVCTVAALLMAFHLFFYGPPMAWLYYAFLGVIFWVAILNFARLRWLLAAALPLYLSSSLISERARFREWFANRPSPVTAGFAVDPATLSTWTEIRSLARSSSVALLSFGGDSAILFPYLDTAPRLFMDPGLTLPEEIEATRTTLRRADYVVEIQTPDFFTYSYWPSLAQELQKFATIRHEGTVTVLKRVVH